MAVCVYLTLPAVETVGYIGRILSHSNNEALGPYIMQALLILVAPALFAASIYMTLGRIIVATGGQSLSVIRLKWLTKLFVTGDVISFLIQGSGGGIQAAGTIQLLHMGQKIILAGLFIQLIVFGLFIITSTVFHARIRRRPTEKSSWGDIPWEKMIYTLYVMSILIMIRSIFRVIEYIQGNSGIILTNEWYLYVFDAVFMAATMVCFLIIHPGTLPQSVVTDEQPVSMESF